MATTIITSIRVNPSGSHLCCFDRPLENILSDNKVLPNHPFEGFPACRTVFPLTESARAMHVIYKELVWRSFEYRLLLVSTLIFATLHREIKSVAKHTQMQMLMCRMILRSTFGLIPNYPIDAILIPRFNNMDPLRHRHPAYQGNPKTAAFGKSAHRYVPASPWAGKPAKRLP